MQLEPHNTLRFDSVADLHSYMTPNKCNSPDTTNTWYGGVTAKTACDMLLTGDQSRVAAAQLMLDKFDVRINTFGMEMATGVAGFCPSVADYLGGSPESMYCMAETQSQAAPLKIIVDTVSSACISQEQINQRGTTILAMVMALAAVRPITLEVVTILDTETSFYFNECGFKNNNYCCARVAINSAPLDLGTACYALCHSGFSRRVLYGALINKYNSPGIWPGFDGKQAANTRDPKIFNWYLSMLGETEESALFIPAIFAQDDLLTKPVEWINSVLAKYTN